MERAGLGRRLPAIILDALFVGILISIAMFVYSVAGGARLAVRASESLGVPVTFSTMASDQVWDELEREAEQMIRDLERQVRRDFTDEEADFIGRTMADTMEDYIDPETIDLEFVLQLDARVIDEMIDESFDAVIAADRPGIEATEVNALRAEVKQLVDEFALGRIIPDAIRFAVWFVLIPVIVALAYGFTEAVWGRTLGKMVLGIAIRPAADTAPAVPGFMLRYALKYAPFLLAILAVATRIPVFVYLSGVTWIVVVFGSLAMIGPERRALHDYVAGTAVYHVSSDRL
jgi:uncharacterized RDD family membrane protein YckC